MSEFLKTNPYLNPQQVEMMEKLYKKCMNMPMEIWAYKYELQGSNWWTDIEAGNGETETGKNKYHRDDIYQAALTKNATLRNIIRDLLCGATGDRLDAIKAKAREVLKESE